MDAWWNNALQVAEKAKSVAKTVSQKGLEFAEATAEEAGRKLKDMGLSEGVAAPHPPPALAKEEVEAYAITSDFQDFVRSLNYGTFRDFPESQLVVLNKQAPHGDLKAAAAPLLNPWQVQHAKLVVQAVKEVNELRFVLCPRYMTDERFWHVYFTLVAKYLPEKAYNWVEGDLLPYKPGKPAAADGFSLAAIGDRLLHLGDKLHAQAGRELGMELTPVSFRSGNASDAAAAAEAPAAAPGGAAPGPETQKSSTSVLESDPDLEAYLQVAIEEAGDGGLDGAAEADDDAGDEELDLDSYINELADELAEEVKDESEGEAAAAVPAAEEGAAPNSNKA